jgi:hypothetical protein
MRYVTEARIIVLAYSLVDGVQHISDRTISTRSHDGGKNTSIILGSAKGQDMISFPTTDPCQLFLHYDTLKTGMRGNGSKDE